MMTNLCKLVCVLALFAGVAACDDDTGANSGNDLATATLADMTQTAAHDLAMSGGDGGSGDGGLKALCAPCTVDGECESGSCLPYMGGQKHFCSHSCAPATAGTDCPGVGMCSGMNVCKCM